MLSGLNKCGEVAFRLKNHKTFKTKDYQCACLACFDIITEVKCEKKILSSFIQSKYFSTKYLSEFVYFFNGNKEQFLDIPFSKRHLDISDYKIFKSELIVKELIYFPDKDWGKCFEKVYKKLINKIVEYIKNNVEKNKIFILSIKIGLAKEIK